MPPSKATFSEAVGLKAATECTCLYKSAADNKAVGFKADTNVTCPATISVIVWQWGKG